MAGGGGRGRRQVRGKGTEERMYNLTVFPASRCVEKIDRPPHRPKIRRVQALEVRRQTSLTKSYIHVQIAFVGIHMALQHKNLPSVQNCQRQQPRKGRQAGALVVELIVIGLCATQTGLVEGLEMQCRQVDASLHFDQKQLHAIIQ